jgi:hypothetical protein
MYNSYSDSDNEITCLTAICGFFSGISAAMASYRSPSKRSLSCTELDKCNEELFDPILERNDTITKHIKVSSPAFSTGDTVAKL